VLDSPSGSPFNVGVIRK